MVLRSKQTCNGNITNRSYSEDRIFETGRYI